MTTYWKVIVKSMHEDFLDESELELDIAAEDMPHAIRLAVYEYERLEEQRKPDGRTRWMTSVTVCIPGVSSE